MQREQSLQEIDDYFEAHFRNDQWEKNSMGQYIKNPPYRKLLQDFPGIVRQHFGEEIFAKLLLSTLKTEMEEEVSVICDDLRLPDEKVLLEENGFLITRFDISKEEQHRRLIETYGSYDKKALCHQTEVALDDADFNFQIDVTGRSVPDIVNKMMDFLTGSFVC